MATLDELIDERIKEIVREELAHAQEQLPPLKEFYSDKELRELAGGVSATTTWRWRRQGFISFSQPPGSRSVMYTREQVREFLKSCERHRRA
jgi:hypothetical protein